MIGGDLTLKSVFKLKSVDESMIEIERTDFVDGVLNRHETQTFDLQDKKIRGALISLGWRPPESE